MIDRAALDAAAAAGVISPQQAAALHDFLATGVPAPRGEEDLRFIRNFHDVFLAIGILLFALGLAIGIGAYAASTKAVQAGITTIGVLAALAALAMWGLGEFFARRRRLFLPAIAIILSLTGFAVVSAAALYGGAIMGRGFELNVDLRGMPAEAHVGILIALGVGVLAPLAFYARFRLPFSLGLAGAMAAMFVIVGALLADFEAAMQFLPALNLALGLLLFAGGVAFDARDPARTTRFSDNGFWLHFAAAPLLLNGAFGLVGQPFDGKGDTASIGGMLVGGAEGGAVGPALATLLVVSMLGLVSLLINRRALIVSALLTTGAAIGVLLNAVGLGAGSLAASTLVVLGAFVLILGAGWHSARRGLLGWVKPDGALARFFPPEPAIP